jgi:pimeloyl-ACP methyl ester carboxylesterase
VVVHGGFGVVEMFGDVLDRLAERRRVVAVELQGHGRTPDIDRQFSFQAFGDDLAAVIDHLELGRADLLGYSLGAVRACARRSRTRSWCGGWSSSPRRAAATAGTPR